MKVLEDVIVVDFTQAYSGPFCTMQLADFGATVIKIERRGSGDQSREWVPIKNGNSGYYAAINRNKLGMELDLSQPEGVEIARRLIEKADILVENFKVGTMEKKGLGYEEIRKINPEIIYASLTGFGQNGPLKELAAYDNVVQSMSGIMDMTGLPDSLPTRVGPAIGDNLTGLYMALGVVMAYYHKLNTGKGQFVDVAMLDTIFGILESPVLFSTLLNKTLKRCGNNDAETLVPYDVYRCADGYFSAGIAGDAGWPKFCKAIHMEALLEDERFRTNEDRCRNYEAITPLIAEFFQDKTKAELEEIFRNSGIPNAPVLTVPEIMEHEQIIAREMAVDFHDNGVGDYPAIGNPMKLSATPAALTLSAPLLGQDTETILRSFDFTAEEIRAFQQQGVI